MAFWALNIEKLGTKHPVYAFDTLGLARSSRPMFSNDPHEIEQVRGSLLQLNFSKSLMIDCEN